MKRATPSGRRRTAQAKRVPIEQVTAELRSRIDALARRRSREAAERGEPWPRPRDLTDVEAAEPDDPEDFDDAFDDAEDTPAAADPHAAALALLGHWHVPEDDA